MTDWDSRWTEGNAVEDEAYVISEDGVYFRSGDEVYDYYDMEPGVIEISEADQERLLRPETPRRARKTDIWFHFKPHGKSGVHILNGDRICSMHFARVRKWPGA